MAQPFWSQYRLRIDDFRVYYDIDASKYAVNILRVLKKGTGPTPQSRLLRAEDKAMKTVTWTEHIAWETTVRQAEHEEVLVMRDGHAVRSLDALRRR